MPSKKKGFAGLVDLTSDSIYLDKNEHHENDKLTSTIIEQTNDYHIDYPKYDRKPSGININVVIGTLSIVAISFILYFINSNPFAISPTPETISSTPPEEKEEVITSNTEIAWNGGTYEGTVKEGKPHGQGIWVGPDGDVYDGEWSSGVMQGVGTYTWSDGREYHGDWVDNNRHGEGKWTHPNGGSYFGDWENDLLHGYGTRVWPNGDKYEGNYKNSNRDGDGVFNYGNGDKYEGSYKDHLYHGQGIKYYANGDIYEGNWKEGLYHGQGTKYFADGTVYEGEWNEGDFINELLEDSPDSEIVPLIYRNICEQKINLHINGRFASVIQPDSEFRFRVNSGENVFEIYNQNNIFIKRYVVNISARNDDLIDVYQFSDCHLLPIDNN